MANSLRQERRTYGRHIEECAAEIGTQPFVTVAKVEVRPQRPQVQFDICHKLSLIITYICVLICVQHTAHSMRSIDHHRHTPAEKAPSVCECFAAKRATQYLCLQTAARLSIGRVTAVSLIISNLSQKKEEEIE